MSPLSLISVATLDWFLKQRGRALSFMGIGGFISAVLLPPMNTLLIEKVGWREAWLVWIGIIIVSMYPLSFCFYYSKPEDIGSQGEPTTTIDGEEDD